jgi:hypothetical protein
MEAKDGGSMMMSIVRVVISLYFPRSSWSSSQIETRLPQKEDFWVRMFMVPHYNAPIMMTKIDDNVGDDDSVRKIKCYHPIRRQGKYAKWAKNAMFHMSRTTNHFFPFHFQLSIMGFVSFVCHFPFLQAAGIIMSGENDFCSLFGCVMSVE